MSILRLLVSGILLADGVIATIAAIRVFRSRSYGSRVIALLLGMTGVGLGFLVAAVIAPANSTERVIYFAGVLVALAIALWPASVWILTTKRPVFGSITLSLIDKIPTALMISDFDGRILFINQALCQITGYTDQYLIGEKVEVLVPALCKDVHEQHRKDYYSNPANRKMGEGTFLLRRKDGSHIEVVISLAAHDRSYVMSVVQLA